jgi:hypothetical protein
MGMNPRRARDLGIPEGALLPTAASKALAARMGMAQDPAPICAGPEVRSEPPGWRAQAAEIKGDRGRTDADRGRSAQASGQQAEAEVVAACRWYRAAGLALLDKVPTPTTRHKAPAGLRPGWFVASYTPRDPRDGAPVDFTGVALVGGVARALRIEVKSSGTGHLPLARHGEPILPPHQVADLELGDTLGATAGVLARVARVWWWWPWRVWAAEVRSAQARGQASLHAADIARAAVRCATLPTGGPAFLAAIEGGI